MTQQLLKLIAEYQLHVLGSVQALRARLGTDDLLGAWRRGEIAERGTLDDLYESRYRFHGVGCHVESERGEVDFDFGPGGRIDGFDGWRLWPFAQSPPQDYPDFQRQEIVESVLGELVTDGIVVRPRWMPSPHLCYLRDDCANDDISFGERRPDVSGL